MRTHELHRSTRIAASLEEVFAFFADAANLETLTPPFLRFEILTPPPIVMAEGTILDYRIRLHGIPVRWRTEISVWMPGRRFVDRQIRGPYRLWEHEHLFFDEGDGVRMEDRVRYAHRGGSLVERWLVRPDLERIFDFREARLQAVFASGDHQPHSPADVGSS